MTFMDWSSTASALEPWAALLDAIIGLGLVVPPLIRWFQERRRKFDSLAVLNHVLPLYDDPNPSAGLPGWKRVVRSIGTGLGGGASGLVNSIVLADATRALGTLPAIILGGAVGIPVAILCIDLVHRLIPTPREKQSRLRRELVRAEKRIH